MRYLLLLLSLLLMLVPVSVYGFGYWGPLVVDECTTPQDGDELNEGFLGTGYENVWTETVGTNGTLDEDYTLSGTPPDGSCTEGLKSSITAGAGDTYTQWDNGSLISRSADMDIYFELYIDSYTLDTLYDNAAIFSWTNTDDPTDTATMAMRLIHGDSGLSIRTDGSSNAQSGVISVDTWYTGYIHLDATASASYLLINEDTSCDEVDECSFTRLDVQDGRYLSIGAFEYYDADDAVDIQWGRVWVDTP